MSGNKLRQAAAGFTLVEVMVTVTLMATIGVVFLGLSANYFVVIVRNNELAEMTISSQNLLRSTVENIRLGNGVRQDSVLPDAHAPVGGWSTSNSSFVIIIAVPALDASKNYIIDPETGSPYMNELVYYKDGLKLMQRQIANPNAPGNRLKTSCPVDQATSTCPPDILLANYVNYMNFYLYDQDSNATTDATAARSVKIVLNMQRNAPGNPLDLTTTMRVTLRNRF